MFEKEHLIEQLDEIIKGHEEQVKSAEMDYEQRIDELVEYILKYRRLKNIIRMELLGMRVDCVNDCANFINNEYYIIEMLKNAKWTILHEEN